MISNKALRRLHLDPWQPQVNDLENQKNKSVPEAGLQSRLTRDMRSVLWPIGAKSKVHRPQQRPQVNREASNSDLALQAMTASLP